MKPLTLLILAILILGCETQTPVAELDVSELDQEISELQVIADLLNRDGIVISFSEPIAVSHIDLRLKDGPTLGWTVQWSADQWTVTLKPANTCSILINHETYVIDISVKDYGCWSFETSIAFITA